MKDEAPKDKNVKVAPERKVTSIWVDILQHKEFIKMCHAIGRRSCDLYEPFEKAMLIAYQEGEKELERKGIPDELKEILRKSAIFINIPSIKIESLYKTRGRQPKAESVYCEKGHRYGDKRFCLHTCIYGGNMNTNKPRGNCDLYQELLRQ